MTSSIEQLDHVYIKREQRKFYDEVKNNLWRSEILVHVGLSEKYKNKHQREVQSAYFGHTTFSIFPACSYLWDIDGKIIFESVTITSELPDYSRPAAITCVLRVIDYWRDKYQHLPLRLNAKIWGDGMASQFRSRFVFKSFSIVDSSVNLMWCYNERHHGNRLRDGTEGALKYCVYRYVMSEICATDNPKQFVKHADKSIKIITPLYLLTEEVLIKPYDIKEFPKIKETLQIHMLKCFFDQQKVAYLEFYAMSTNEKPLFT